eukprot:SAG11_NODE_12564_length_697_cov_0.719064_1_plen_135_part_10
MLRHLVQALRCPGGPRPSLSPAATPVLSPAAAALAGESDADALEREFASSSGDDSAEVREARRFGCRQGPVKSVICIGDSVRMGYEPHVETGLRFHGLDGSRADSEADSARELHLKLLPQGLTQGGDTRNILAHL